MINRYGFWLVLGKKRPDDVDRLHRPGMYAAIGWHFVKSVRKASIQIVKRRLLHLQTRHGFS